MSAANENALIDLERARVRKLRASMADELEAMNKSLDNLAVAARSLSMAALQIVEAQIAARKAALRLNGHVTAALISGEFDDQDRRRV